MRVRIRFCIIYRPVHHVEVLNPLCRVQFSLSFIRPLVFAFASLPPSLPVSFCSASMRACALQPACVAAMGGEASLATALESPSVWLRVKFDPATASRCGHHSTDLF